MNNTQHITKEEKRFISDTNYFRLEWLKMLECYKEHPSDDLHEYCDMLFEQYTSRMDKLRKEKDLFGVYLNYCILGHGIGERW